MKQTGTLSLNFRVPALAEKELIYLDSKQFAGRWVALSFLPNLGLMESAFLDHQAEIFGQIDTALLMVSSGARPLHRWLNCPMKPRVPLLADPLGRLHRSFGVTVAHLPARCHTFLIDRAGILRFHLIHDFTDRGLSALHEIVTLSQAQETGRVTARDTIADTREEVLKSSPHLVWLHS